MSGDGKEKLTHHHNPLLHNPYLLGGLGGLYGGHLGLGYGGYPYHGCRRYNPYLGLPRHLVPDLLAPKEPKEGDKDKEEKKSAPKTMSERVD